MIKWALGLFAVLVGLAVTARIGKKEASRLLEAMAANDGSDEVGANYRDSFKAKRPMVIDHDEMPTHDPYARYGYLQGPEEPAVRRARQHITARRAMQI